jgi:OmpR-family two-component system manganese-sensing sensor histidine kinase
MVVAISAIGWWLSGIAMRPVLDSYERLRQFTADASHELRSPISSIQTNIQVALREPDESRVRDRLSVVERTTRRLSQLVDDLLFLARQDSPMGDTEFEFIPLDALLLETVEEQQAIAADKQLLLHLDIHDSLLQPLDAAQSLDATDDPADVPEAEPYSIYGNWNQIARLFTNLLSNAIRYTPEQGEIQVILRDRQDGTDRQTIVEIRDTGIGIAPEDLTRIFERFYRVDTSRHRQIGSEHGSGLGLSIVKAIADRHGAQIAIDSQCDRGTTIATIFTARSFEHQRKFTVAHNVQSM